MAFALLESLISRPSTSAADSEDDDYDGEITQDNESDIDDDIVQRLVDSDDEDEADVPRGNDWSDTLHNVNIEDFEGSPGVNPALGLDHTSEPYNYFCAFIPETFYGELATQTNIYAANADKRPTSWFDASADDMKLFFYINGMFGIHKMPEYKHYWSSNELLGVPAVSNVMSRTRYEHLAKFFHINDNRNFIAKGVAGHDPIFKIRPMFDLVRHSCMINFYPGKNISFDEAMIAFTGRLTFKQYIKNKPTPWGVKIWCAADSDSGYLCDFEVYTGKSDRPKEHGLGYDVVMTLGDRFLNQYHHFYFDNFFASVRLAEDLLERKTYSCATIRSNRKGWPTDLKQKGKNSKTKMLQRGNIVACQFVDKRNVTLLSTNSDPGMTDVTRRAAGGRVEKQIPTPVATYNKNMGGVDLHDQYRSYYPVGRRSLKWWRCLIWFLLQVAIINSYQLYCSVHRRSATTRKLMTHLDFRLSIFSALKNSAKAPARKRSATEVTPAVFAPHDIHTKMKFSGRKKTCFLCRKSGRRTEKSYPIETYYGCTKCQLHLCPGTCFDVYHERLHAATDNDVTM